MAPRTVAEVAALQARLMPTTRRMGPQSEDPTMAAARPALAELNRLGLVTVDSQMGLRRDEWGIMQRAYVSGFAAKPLAAALVAAMDLVSGVFAQRFAVNEAARQRAEAHAMSDISRLTLTYDGASPINRHPLAVSQGFESLWVDLLPETRLRKRTDVRDAVAGEVEVVFFADMQWGRRDWLFARLATALRRVAGATEWWPPGARPPSKRGKKGNDSLHSRRSGGPVQLDPGAL